MEDHCCSSSVLEFRIKAEWADQAASTTSTEHHICCPKSEAVFSIVEKPMLNTALNNYDFLFSARGLILDLILQGCIIEKTMTRIGVML